MSKKKNEKDKKMWKLKNVSGKQWMQAGKAISGTAKNLSDTQASEKLSLIHISEPTRPY